MTDETKATALDASAIASNPEPYGFKWVYRDLNKKKGKGGGAKVLLRANVPHIEMPETREAVELVYRYFPATVYAGWNGTSAVIRGQNVARPYILANPQATDMDIKVHIVRSVLLNQITRSRSGSRTVYVGADGKEYGTLAEAQAATGGKLTTAVSVVDLAAQFMAEAIDMGVSPERARAKAAEKWPDAFTVEDEDDGEEDESEVEDGSEVEEPAA